MSSTNPNSVIFPVLLQKLDFPRKLGLYEKLFGEQLKKRGIVEVATACGVTWKLDLRNGTHRWIVYGLYDPPFLKWAKRTLRVDGVVVDSGANIGQTAMVLGQYVSQGKLFAFEPGAAARDWLSGGVAKNRALLSSIEIVPLALGKKTESLFLSDTWGERFHGASSRISGENGEPVSVVKLSDFLEKKGVRQVDLWKLDIEGYEMQALEGAVPWLSDKRIRSLYVELFSVNTPECMKQGEVVKEFLLSLGYEAYEFDRWGGHPKKLSGPARDHNVLFLPKDGKA